MTTAGTAHSPVLLVQARGVRLLSKQIRSSSNAPLGQDVRNAVFGKEGLAAVNCASICPGLSVIGFTNNFNCGVLTVYFNSFRKNFGRIKINIPFDAAVFNYNIY